MKHVMEPFGPACDLDGRGLTHMHLPGLLCGGLGGCCVPFWVGALPAGKALNIVSPGASLERPCSFELVSDVTLRPRRLLGTWQYYFVVILSAASLQSSHLVGFYVE